jgi:hypothetical protein
MNSPTVGTSSQFFTTLSGQTVEIDFYEATSERVYVQVYYDPDTVTATGFESEIADLVAAIVWRIGKSVTAAQIANGLIDYQHATITGCKVSLDDAIWGNQVFIDADKYGSVAVADVHVLEEP